MESKNNKTSFDTILVIWIDIFRINSSIKFCYTMLNLKSTKKVQFGLVHLISSPMPLLEDKWREDIFKLLTESNKRRFYRSSFLLSAAIYLGKRYFPPRI